MINDVSSIAPAGGVSQTEAKAPLRDRLLRRLYISTDRGIAQANLLFAFSFVVWAVIDTLVGDGPIAIPIGAVLAGLFYMFARKLSEGDEPSPRWMRITGRVALGFAIFSAYAFATSFVAPVDVACAIWAAAFVGGFGLYAYHVMSSQGQA